MIDQREIIQIVCDYFKIPMELVLGTTRKREVIEPKRIAVALCYLHLYESVPEGKRPSLKTIASWFGLDNHSTIIYHVKTAMGHIETSKNSENIYKLLNGLILNQIENYKYQAR